MRDPDLDDDMIVHGAAAYDVNRGCAAAFLGLVILAGVGAGVWAFMFGITA